MRGSWTTVPWTSGTGVDNGGRLDGDVGAHGPSGEVWGVTAPRMGVRSGRGAWGSLLAFLCWAGCLAGQEQPRLGTIAEEERQELDTGLVYGRFGTSGSVEGAPISAHVLWVDLDRVEVRQVLALDQVLGQEAPTSMARRYGAVAAINGGFSISNDPWNVVHGDPNGFLVQDGRVVSDPVEPRASAGICRDLDGRQQFRTLRPRTEWVALGDDGREPVNGINRGREPGEVVAYTSDWGRSTITGMDGVEVRVAGDTVVEVRNGGSSPIPEDGFVLSASGDGAAELEGLEVGMPLQLIGRVFDLDYPGDPVDLTGCSFSSAGPVIIRDGVVIREYSREGFRDAFTFVRHPRTALGMSGDGSLIVVVVDGRQDDLSVGMTLPELGDFLAGLGVVLGYNLDGGGSSAMVVDGEVVNSPSDGRERRRSDGVLFLPGVPR